MSRDPAGIALLEVIEVAEGQLVSRSCPMRGGPCRWGDVCALHPTWEAASEAVRSTLAGTTLADVASVDRDLGRRARRRRSGGR